MSPQNGEEGSISLDGASLRTTLISSTLTNVTSTTPSQPRLAPSPACLSQTILGCSISHSADHLSGTTIRDMNLGGSLLCSNSSFAHCTSALGKDYTQGDQFKYASSSITSLNFTFCTFRHMTTTTTSYVGGAAIHIYKTQATLSVSDCAFLNCTTYGGLADGGAVCYWGGTSSGTGQDQSVSLARNAFVSCSTTDAGGALMVYFFALPTISACSFHKNTANYGGCIAVQSISRIVAFNCSFSQNTAGCGGGIGIFYNIQFTFTDLAFRENTATNRTHSTDEYVEHAFSYEFPDSKYTRCDSTSSRPNIYVEKDKVSLSDTFSRISNAFTVSGFSVSHSGTTATIVINTTAAVKGVMSVLISGGLVPRLAFVTFSSTGSTSGTGTTTTSVLPSGTRYWPEIATIPAYKLEESIFIADSSLTDSNTALIVLNGLKLTAGSCSMLVKDPTGTQTNITLSFSNSTTLTASATLYPIDTAKLKYGTTYTFEKVTRVTTSIVVKSGLSFKIPDEPARIVGIWGDLDSSGNSTKIVARGRQIPQGTYTLKLDSLSGPSFDVSFSDAVSEERNSSVASVSIFGDQPVLSFKQAYTIFSLTSKVAPLTSILIDANPNSFIVSEPSRITSLAMSEWSDSSKTTATLTMTGRALKPKSGYTFQLKGLPKATSSTAANTEVDVRTVTVRTSTSHPIESGSKTIVFYPHSSADLLFGYTYEVDSVSLDGSTLLQNSGLSFITPDEPARLSSIESCSLTASKDGVIVIVKGFALQQDTTRMIVKSPDGREIESDGKIEVKTSSECWIKFKTSWEENTTHLEFLKKYTLNIGKSGSSELIITPDLSFTVPSGPIVASISVPLTCSSSSFSVGIVGIDLPIESGFTVELVGGLSFLVDFKSATTGNGTISASLPGQIQFNTDYSVKWVTKEGRKMKCDSVSFRTPLGPTLVDVKADLNASNINNVIVTLESVRMPVGAMTLTVQEGSSTAIPLTVSFVSSKVGSVEVVVFGGSSLKYGTTYKVVSLTSSSLHSSLDKTITFKTPATPPRIQTASCSLVGEWKRDGEVVLTGEAFPAGTPFSISVDEIDETGVVIPGTTPITLSDTFGGVTGDAALTTHTLSIPLFPVPQKMKYSCRYRITSLSISTVPTAVEQTATFEVPTEPARIVGIWGELRSSGNTTNIVVRGRQIPQGTYTLKLDSSTGPSFEVSFSDAVSEERNSSVASVSIFGDQPVLSFKQAYTIFSLTSKVAPLTSILIDANPNSFIVSEPSRITSLVISEWSDSSKTTATLTMTGRALEAETCYAFQLKGLPKSSSSNANTDPHFKTLSITSSSTSPYDVGSLPVVLYPSDSADLLFGYTYTVQSVTQDGTPLLLNSGLTFTTPEEPARISTIKKVSLASSKNAIVLTLAGFALKQDSISITVQSSTASSISSDGVVSVSSPTECTITFRANWVENNTHLQFLKEYTLSGSSGGSELLIDENLSFSAPAGPIVSSLTAPAECTSSSFVVAVAGTDLPIKFGVAIELVGGLSFTVDFNSSTTGQGSIQASLLDQIQFSTTYTVSSVTKDGMTVKADGVTLQTPLGPTLTNVSSALDASNINKVILTLTSLRMPAETFTLTVCECGSSVQILLSVSFSSQIEGKSVVVVYGGTTLKYDTAYAVLSLTSSTLHCSLNQPITFTTPPTPPRIHTASCELVAPSKRSGEITLIGDAFPAGEDFSISLIEIDENDDAVFGSSSITLHSTFDGDSGGPALSSQNLTVLLSPLPQQLKYSSRYRVTAFSIPDVLSAVEDTAIIDIPAEPIRLEDLQPLLASSLETVSVTLIGRRFDIGTFTAKLHVQSPSQGAQFDVGCERVSDTQLLLTLPISTADASSVKFGDVVSVVSLKNGSMAAIQHCSSFTVPHPPRVDTATFSFSTDTNTSFELTLDGTDLHPNTVCSVLLDSNHSFDVIFLNSSTGVSTEMALGWPDTLQYSTKYRIVSIKNKDTDGVVFVGDSLTFTTEKKPRRIIVFCDSASTDSSRLCGCEDRPCSSMDSAWKIAMNVEAKDISIRINLNATLSSPVICLSQGILVIEKGTSTEPKLFVPSSATMGEKGLIEITSGLIEFRDVDVIVESLLSSFVLLFASDCSVVLKDGSIVGKALPSNSQVDELCCEWETGVLQLSHCTTDITETVLSHLPQGAVSMKGGHLSIETCTFHDNSPDLESFPSVRQNVRCVEEGVVEVGSLHGGDGTGDHPSAWISATNCKVGGAEAKQESSFFIPTLSSASSKSTFNKKEQTFTVRIEGKTLIPCDLFLEVFEIEKDKKEGKALPLPLSLDSTTSFTETTISLVVPQMSISSLSSSLELRGRLSFGQAKTNESFVVRMSSSDKMAQSFVNSMKWWIPLVAGVLVTISLVIILVLCWRRRQKKKNEADQTPKAELQEIDIEKMEMPDSDLIVHKTSVRLMTNAGMEQTDTSTLNPSSSTQNRTAQADGQTVVRCSETVDVRVVRQTHTLYQRLHPNTIQFHTKFGLQHRIVLGLSQLLNTKPHSTILTHLSPYAYLFDGEENLFLKADAEKRTGETADKQDPQQPLEMHQHLANIEQKIREEEGLRWEAPEMEFREKEHNAHKAAVFSLGLILWEVETGIVPFVEYDALNAQRQVRMGVKPPTQQIEDRKMREVILECLELNPQDRPVISTILEAFVEMEKEKKQENHPAPKEQTLLTGTAGPVVDLLVFNP
ncbi:hypothetical protein BLNAU_1417 [Blattamonas nauphoetae]|uniref:Protein kinase domain-containing protein n=1 Tax=Blattamonas nauphoetae TaxID=2049346 RepID=A0ABQ9YJD6_9EUKA|nr:hypothetical protein BLNAU_1417 [Blattamonas nauphoetae]